jgi:hypothetical protein
MEFRKVILENRSKIDTRFHEYDNNCPPRFGEGLGGDYKK